MAINHNNYMYLDACSTAPISKEVLDVMFKTYSNTWANPSSIHQLGLDANEILERSRLILSKKFGLEYFQLIFTSGATESNHLALLGSANNLAPGRLVISSVEHPSVTFAAKKLSKLGWDLSFWPVDRFGQIDLKHLDGLLSHPTKLVSLIWGQSEIGSIQPVKLIAEECRKRNIIFHTDASQIFSQGLPDFKELKADYITLSAHKIQGPRGIGLLIKNNTNLLLNSLQGGYQEFGLRGGTEPTALIAGMVMAIRGINNRISFEEHRTIFPPTLTTKLTSQLKILLASNPQFRLIGHPTERLPHHLSYLLHGSQMQPINSREFVRNLSAKGIFLSSGSACSTKAKSKNSILDSIHLNQNYQNSLLRISLGPWISSEQLSTAADTINDVISRID